MEMSVGKNNYIRHLFFDGRYVRKKYTVRSQVFINKMISENPLTALNRFKDIVILDDLRHSFEVGVDQFGRDIEEVFRQILILYDDS